MSSRSQRRSSAPGSGILVARVDAAFRQAMPVAPTSAGGTRPRERLDLRLFLRGMLGRTGMRFTRLLPHWRPSLPKEHLVHSAVLGIVALVVVTNFLATSSDRGSLLFALFSEAEVEEGVAPRPRQDAAREWSGFLSMAPPAAAGGITEEDIEFELSNTLGGNVLVENGSPETAETSSARRSGVVAYTVRDGDTPSTVAARLGVSTNTVLWTNGIRDGDLIRPGDILVILPVTGVLHQVVNGEDVTGIARRYDAKVEDVIAQNGLSSAGAIRAGQKLIIPDGQLFTPRRYIARSDQIDQGPEEPSERPASAPIPGSGFLRPVSFSRITQYFGWRHSGVDLADSRRPLVKAAKDGTVEFAGWLGGYGRLVILRHGNGLKTYYAHLSEIHAKTNETIARGEFVGRVGCTGRCSGPHLHFEVRQGGRPVNPLKYF